jgi:hypothetical protein
MLNRMRFAWPEPAGLLRARARAAKVLPLQHEVREQKREGDAHPDHGFGNRITWFFQSGNTKDYADFEKDDGDGEAARHPLTVQLNLAFQDEVHGDGGGQHPDRSVGERGEAEGAPTPPYALRNIGCRSRAAQPRKRQRHRSDRLRDEILQNAGEDDQRIALVRARARMRP